MSFRRTSMTFCAVFFTLGVLLVGCGGNQSDEDSQSDSSGGTQERQGGGGDQESAETRVAIGRVADAEDRRLIVRSNTGDQGRQRMVFVVPENARIALDGQEASLEDAKKGQQAQIQYVVVKEDRYRAQKVVLFEREGTPENSETTG